MKAESMDELMVTEVIVPVDDVHRNDEVVAVAEAEGIDPKFFNVTESIGSEILDNNTKGNIVGFKSYVPLLLVLKSG